MPIYRLTMMPKVFLKNIGIQPLWAKCPFSETDNKVKTLVDISHQELIFMWIAFHQMWDVSSHGPDHSCHRTFTVRIGFFFPQHQPKTGNVEMTKPLRIWDLTCKVVWFPAFYCHLYNRTVAKAQRNLNWSQSQILRM